MPDYPQITTAGIWNINIQQGSSFIRTIVFAEDFDVTPFSFRGSIRRAHRDRNVLASFSFEKISGTEVEISLTPQQSGALPAANLVHDIEMYYREGSTDLFVSRIIEGKVKVTPEVTR